MRHLLAPCAAALLLLLTTTGSASAHASLTRATIKNNAVLHAGHTPTLLQAFFAENLDPKQSWLNVFAGSGDHGLVNEHTRSKVNFRNPREMTLTLPALRPASYYFIWYTHSVDDGHYAAGIVYFRVVK